MRERRFTRNVPHQQAFVQGQNSNRNSMLTQNVRAANTVQIGNKFLRQIRPDGFTPHSEGH